MTLSLQQFSREAVDCFLELVAACQPAPSHTQDEDNNNNENEDYRVAPHAIDRLGTEHNDHVVECCFIAHYLNCPLVLDAIVESILVPSIDSDNCLSLYQLADFLSLPTLHGATLQHILQALDSNDVDDASGAGGGLYTQYLTPELRQKIQSIKEILRYQNREAVFFDTFVEYIAVLAEQYQYNRERLDEALVRRKYGTFVRCRSFFFTLLMYSSFSPIQSQEQQARLDSRTPEWQDAQLNIRKQTVFVQKLKEKLEKEKILFGIGQGN